MVTVNNTENRELLVPVGAGVASVKTANGLYTIKTGMNDIPDDVWDVIKEMKFISKRLTRKPVPGLLVIAATPVAPPEPPKRGPGRPPKSDG